MVRRAALALGFWLAGVAASHAADGAELNILGFSSDSRYFAFEQFGVQDGSGFAYDEIFVVDLTKDAWVKGAPIRVQAKDENMPLASVMKEARGKYAPLEKSLAITTPAEVFARNTATEVIADRRAITFDTWYLASEFGATPDSPNTLQEARYTLSLSEKKLPRPGTCPEDMGDDWKGLTLKLRAAKSGTERELFSDASVPASRGCPFGYDIQAVLAAYGDTKSDQMVAIVGVYTLGFEGKDLRYMAVPFKLNP